MGRNLDQDVILTYAQSKPHFKKVIKNAANQLAVLFDKFKGETKSHEDALYFGTETEVHVLIPRKYKGEVVYSVTENVRDYVNYLREVHSDKLRLEFEMGSWMLEVIPRNAFTRFLDINEIYQHFKYISVSMDEKQVELDKEMIFSSPSPLPHAGTLTYWVDKDGNTIPMEERQALNKLSGSTTFLDFTIAKNLRALKWCENMIERRGNNPTITLPLFQDKNTTLKEVTLDHLGYGSGCCALQSTYSSVDMEAARFLYDQISIMSFMFQCISNSSSVVNGKLSNQDGRWLLLEGANDERAPKEYGKIPKSRFSALSFYISNDIRNRHRYNDLKFVINKKFKKTLKHVFKKRGSQFYKDTRLLNHFAYFFIREPLLISESDLEDDREETISDFDQIQGSNWHNVRFKPPASLDSKIGWLMEFRSMDLPITAREKSALVFLVTLFVRMINDKDLKVNFYVPMSKANDNFYKALERDADINSKFNFRKYFSGHLHKRDALKDDMVELTLAELLEGNQEFDGLKKLIEAFIELNKSKLDEESHALGYNIVECIWDIFEFYLERCKGKLVSNARFIRNFVMKHPDYKQDSIVSPSIVKDMIEKLKDIQKEDFNQELLGERLKTFFK